MGRIMTLERLLLAATLSLGLSSGATFAAEPAAGARAAAAQDEQTVLVDTIRANRKAFVAVNMDLDAEQAKSFWPLYDKYQSELNPIQDRTLKLVDEYTTHFKDLGDERAVQLVQEYLAAESDRLEVRRKYVPEFQKILPGRTVARFYQLENKLDAVMRYELARTIPVIDEKAAPPAK